MKLLNLLSIFILLTSALSQNSFFNNTILPVTRPTISTAIRQDATCASFCRFRLCMFGEDGEEFALPVGIALPFGMAFTSAGPFICRPDSSTIGRVLRVQQARVRIRSGRFIRIPRLGRRSLRARINGGFYGVRDFDVPEKLGRSSIRRSKFRSSDQRGALEGKCVYLPLRVWEVMRNDGTVSRVVSAKDRRNCVSFTATGSSTRMKIMLRWDTAADLDLSVTEPDGTAVNFDNRVSPTSGGFLVDDNTLGDCDMNSAMRSSSEVIEYTGISTPADGTYTISLSQFASCTGVSSDYYISVMIGDMTVIDIHGSVAPLAAPLAEGEDGVVFRTFAFDFPSGDIVDEVMATPDM